MRVSLSTHVQFIDRNCSNFVASFLPQRHTHHTHALIYTANALSILMTRHTAAPAPAPAPSPSPASMWAATLRLPGIQSLCVKTKHWAESKLRFAQ